MMWLFNLNLQIWILYVRGVLTGVRILLGSGQFANGTEVALDISESTICAIASYSVTVLYV